MRSLACSAEVLHEHQCLPFITPFKNIYIYVFQEIKEMSHANVDVLTQYQAHMFTGMP